MSNEKSVKDRIKELEEKLAAAEAKIAEGEDGALKRVSKALGIDSAEITEKENLPPEDIIRCHVPFPVRVNATVYHGSVDVPRSTFYVIQQAIGDRNARIMNELTGKNYLLTEQSFAPKVIGQVGLQGEKLG